MFFGVLYPDSRIGCRQKFYSIFRTILRVRAVIRRASFSESLPFIFRVPGISQVRTFIPPVPNISRIERTAPRLCRARMLKGQGVVQAAMTSARLPFCRGCGRPRADSPMKTGTSRSKSIFSRAGRSPHHEQIGLPDPFADGMGRIAGQRTNVRRAALHTTRAGAELRAVNIDPFDVGSGLPQGVGGGAERLDDNSLRAGRSVEDKCFHGAAGFLPAPIVTLLR